MKIYLNSVKENWIVDRVKKEWITLNKNITSNYLFNSEIIWIIAPWTWKKINKKHLQNKLVVCSIYHIDEEKFDASQLFEFKQRDKYVDKYHVISKKTEQQIKKFTDKPIFTSPFWINHNIFFELENKKVIRKKYNINSSSFVIGSFQRDTEGSDLISPKLSKGPDRLIEVIEHFVKNKNNVTVLLAGKRRNFIINELEKRGINYKYFEMVDFTTLNELYNCLDLYVVSSRYEGGPQAILECAISKTPIISTDVGVASEILATESIFTMDNISTARPNIDEAFKNAQKFIIPNGLEEYRNFFKELYEN